MAGLHEALRLGLVGHVPAMSANCCFVTLVRRAASDTKGRFRTFAAVGSNGG